MRIVLGFLSGILGMLAGWFGLAFLVVSLAGPDRDGGTAMGAFFNIGPIGAVVGFGIGVWLFAKFGLVGRRHVETSPALVPSAEVTAAPSAETAAAPAARRISRPFAIAVVATVTFLAWWGWYELIRSPYLTHGDMPLALQFRLPSGMAPPDPKDVHILLDEGGNTWPGDLNGNGWLGHQDDRAVMLATVTMSYKAWHRTITLTMPDGSMQSWSLNLPYNPDPTPGYTEWLPSSKAADAIELNYRLTAER